MPSKKRVLVACSIESGSGVVSRALAEYLGAPLIDRCSTPWHNLEHEIAQLGDKPFVLRAHVRGYGPDLETVRKQGVQVVFLWRNLGDTVIALDERIRSADFRSPLFQLHDRGRYLELPPQHRYAYLIDHALPWLAAFYLSWSGTPRAFPIIRGRHEHMASDPQGFFEALLEALGLEPEHRRVERAIDRAMELSRLNESAPGRSAGLLSDMNRRRLDDFLLRHPEDLSEPWAELPWRKTARPATGSLLSVLAGQPYNARAGTMEPAFPGLRAAIETDGFWIHVPGALVAPSEGRTARLRMVVRGQAGPVFRLAWGGGRMEQQRPPGAGPAAIDFVLGEAHAQVQEFRLDCFNGSRRRGTGEILEFVKIEA